MAPHLAASVILLREPRSGELEVCMLRRRRGASFMASAFVFPGGGAEPGESLPACAARELFEEAGVLLAAPRDDAAHALQIPALRTQLAEPGAHATALLQAAGWRWAEEALLPWSHWITPSVEPKRFSAHFFVAALPPDQEPAFDAVETVEQVWVRPADAEARAAELALPPPQLRTLWELRDCSSITAVQEAARRRAAAPHPILPRLAPLPGSSVSSDEVSPVPRTNPAAPGAGAMCLLLPWDRDYLTLGHGDAAEMNPPPFWAEGPSRFVLEDRAWRQRYAPASTREA